MNKEERRINNKCNFIDNLLIDNGLYKGVSASLEVEEHISNLYNEIDNYKHQLEEKEQEIRLDQTKKVFKVLAEAITNGSISYRTLIYDKLGFIDYADLIDGLTITNAIVDLEEKDKVINNAIGYIKKHMYENQVDVYTIVNDLDNGVDELLEILERGKNEK